MEITKREERLIVIALYILESQCAGGELNYELEDDLGGTPDPGEIRTLMEKIKSNSRST